MSLLEFIGIQQELEDELGLNVDLVEYEAIKPALKDEILRDEEFGVYLNDFLDLKSKVVWILNLQNH